MLKVLTELLDEYNWFYTFNPFEKELYEKVVDNICEVLIDVRVKFI